VTAGLRLVAADRELAAASAAAVASLTPIAAAVTATPVAA
jgi:hypothetical protein